MAYLTKKQERERFLAEFLRRLREGQELHGQRNRAGKPGEGCSMKSREQRKSLEQLADLFGRKVVFERCGSGRVRATFIRQADAIRAARFRHNRVIVIMASTPSDFRAQRNDWVRAKRALRELTTGAENGTNLGFRPTKQGYENG